MRGVWVGNWGIGWGGGGRVVGGGGVLVKGRMVGGEWGVGKEWVEGMEVEGERILKVKRGKGGVFGLDGGEVMMGEMIGGVGRWEG